MDTKVDRCLDTYTGSIVIGLVIVTGGDICAVVEKDIVRHNLTR